MWTVLHWYLNTRIIIANCVFMCHLSSDHFSCYWVTATNVKSNHTWPNLSTPNAKHLSPKLVEKLININMLLSICIPICCLYNYFISIIWFPLPYTCFIFLLLWYQKLGGLKQHTVILWELWTSEVQNGSQWAQIKVPASCVPPWSPQGRIGFLAFPASRGSQHSLAQDPFPHLQSQ